MHDNIQPQTWDQLPWESLNPSLQRQMVYGEQAMISRIRLKKGAQVPEHSHSNEQIAYIVEGKLKFTLAGRDMVACAGQVLVIPGGVPHSAEALEDTLNLDVFAPPRQDWIRKEDAYLR